MMVDQFKEYMNRDQDDQDERINVQDQELVKQMLGLAEYTESDIQVDGLLLLIAIVVIATATTTNTIAIAVTVTTTIVGVAIAYPPRMT
jgi:hypothetical protein